MKNHPQTILLLGGERPAGSPQDGTPETLNALKASLKVEQLTEQDLLREICGKVLQDVKRKGDVIHDLDVPRKELPRPTTESTLVFLMNWLKKRSDITSITFVSSQPHIGYQRALVEQARLLYGGVQSFEVVGPYYKVEKGAELQSLKRLVEGLGAFIWAQTPLVMHQLKLAPYEFEAHQERMKILYKPDSFGDRILTQLSQKKSVKKEK